MILIKADGRTTIAPPWTKQLQRAMMMKRRPRFGAVKFRIKESNGMRMRFPIGNDEFDQCRRGRVFISAAIDVIGLERQKCVDDDDDNVWMRNSKTVVAVILGGGAGMRLFPLTSHRAKPVVPIGGAYRLIDVPMSNCINSGINKIYILTQFNSTTLNRHIFRTYSHCRGNGFGDGYVELLAATQTNEDEGWFQGTADAVRQFYMFFEEARSKKIEDVLILSADHLYRMEYMDLVKAHRRSGADITISGIPVNNSQDSDFGVMNINSTGKVLSYCKKPEENSLTAMELDATILGLSKGGAQEKPYIASIEVYLFKKEILLDLLRCQYPVANDFGLEIMPEAAKNLNVKAYMFNGYWQDIGTIKSFFEANLALTDHSPKFNFYDASRPIYTSRRNLPPSKLDSCKIINSIISHGCFISDSLIEHSVIGIRSKINPKTHLKDTVMLGANFYETDCDVAARLAEGGVPIGIGENTKISNCIIDKNARIGKEGINEADRAAEGFYIRSGIIVILKNSVIKDETVI